MSSEKLSIEPLEDEAPKVKYQLTENEPLWTGRGAPPQPLLPAKSAATEYMGAARVSQYGVPGQLDIEVHCLDKLIEVGPFRMTVPEGCQLALAIMDAVHWFVREPERLRIAQELANLYRECEEAPVV